VNTRVMMSKEKEMLYVGLYLGFVIGVTLMMIINIRKEARIMEHYGIEIEYEEDYYEEDIWQY
jgi:hypothetical protein